MTPPITWSVEPAPMIMAIILMAVYLRRWISVRRSSDRRDAPVWRLCSWTGGALVLVTAQGNPIDGLGDYMLVWHMVQHLMLLDLFPLLLLFGLNRVIMRPITRRVQWLEQRVGFLAKPWFGLIAYTGGMWIWHAPFLYDAAARHDTIHLLEHMTFTGVGFLYWWHLLRPIPSRDRMTDMTPMAYMGVTKVTVGILGMALTFAPRALYAFYSEQPAYWGLSPQADQAMAGALMATEQVLIMGVAFGVLFMRGLKESELRAQREERLMDRRALEVAGVGRGESVSEAETIAVRAAEADAAAADEEAERAAQAQAAAVARDTAAMRIGVKGR